MLLDAVQVEDLLKRLYQWVDSPCVNVLYLGTRFGALKDVSPCLVQIKGEYDPILAQFLENLDRHWGYLLISEGPWVQLVAHLRWLISIEHPSGQEMLLRSASTDVADSLFESADSALFGPCQRIMTAALVNGGWRLYTR
ncbi:MULTISPECIES: DUF4123 domain-containing protein [unclassified Pseudomonas]|uniref:DUF4123 domain-containing protein n=1 Tax=unclassified Pseudomonas TaxID=196821 RepID=UPI002B22B893|nr:MULTISPECIES: DUF4123 domain-containing protein [unclassified Pseudomonas]MEA9977019.1 DUF4123 domain-containing protein [Pseudomonas sp. RTS4]MEB0199712.1 DUF4123 domain-containing protein [Pseudomonas sp. 5S4]MEB0247414.1 DUF4123 domain-containing protein [Pseudomonas sp. 10S5]